MKNNSYRKSDRYFIAFIIILIAIFGYYFWSINQSSQSGDLDNFASCLGKNGATFYGAFWCPHCQNQKKMFGSSERLLPYAECSTPDQSGQLQVCIDKKINGYPTWEFADGSRLSGEVSLQTLSEKTGCSLQASMSGSSSNEINTSTASSS